MPARYTPPEQALKSYETTINETPYLPIDDYDGNYIEVDFDRDHGLEFNDIDDCITSMKEHLEEGKKYELTITFDRKIHTYFTMLNIKKHLKIIKYYLEETLKVNIEGWYYVKEYHKTPMGVLKKRPPHYHMMIIVDEEIEPSQLWNLNKAFNRHFGMNTMRPVESVDKYVDYMFKEVVHNMKTTKQPHIFRVD